jgi:hypothetical protein
MRINDQAPAGTHAVRLYGAAAAVLMIIGALITVIGGLVLVSRCLRNKPNQPETHNALNESINHA